MSWLAAKPCSRLGRQVFGQGLQMTSLQMDSLCCINIHLLARHMFFVLHITNFCSFPDPHSLTPCSAFVSLCFLTHSTQLSSLFYVLLLCELLCSEAPRQRTSFGNKPDSDLCGNNTCEQLTGIFWHISPPLCNHTPAPAPGSWPQ